MKAGGLIYFVMVVFLVGLNALTFHEVFSCKNPSIYEEGEFVECISAFSYLCASIITFFRGFHRRGLERKLTWFFSVTTLLFFIRELDLEGLNIPSLLITLGTGTGRDVLFVLLFLALIFSVFASQADRASLSLKTFFLSKIVQLSVAGALLLVLGSLFEKLHLSMVEEILEMNGSVLILFAAILHEWLPLSSSAGGRKPLQF